MKKLLLVLLGLIMIFSLVFLFSGCDLLKNTVENLMKDAELASKALSDSGYARAWSQTTGLKSVVPTSPGNISDSQYTQNLGASPTTFALIFSEHPISIQDENVTVTLDGTVNYGYIFNTTGTTSEFKMVIYSSDVNIKVGDDDMGSVPVDLYFYFSTSLTATTVSATIEGNVGNYTVNTSLTVNVPSI